MRQLDDDNSNSHISIVCNANCINTSEINKISMRELFRVILIFIKSSNHEKVELRYK